MRESALTKARLPISFALSLCTGAAVFRILHALIAVEDPPILCPVPDVEYRPEVRIIECPAAPKRRHKPELETPKPAPETPPIAIEKHFDFLDGQDVTRVRFR